MRLVPRFPAAAFSGSQAAGPGTPALPPEWRFSRLGADRLTGRPSGALMPRVRHRSEAVDVDRGQLVGRRLKDRPIVVRLREVAPVGGRAAGGRAGRRLERLAERSARKPRSRFGTEITHCRTVTGGMT